MVHLLLKILCGKNPPEKQFINGIRAYIYLFYLFIYFFTVLGFELSLYLELFQQPYFVMGLMNYLPWPALNLDPPDLCLLSS
jgi:hypothetical protein